MTTWTREEQEAAEAAAELDQIDQPGPPLADLSQLYVVPVPYMEAIVAYLIDRPWREVDQILTPIDGLPTLDQFLPPSGPPGSV